MPCASPGRPSFLSTPHDCIVPNAPAVDGRPREPRSHWLAAARADPGTGPAGHRLGTTRAGTRQPGPAHLARPHDAGPGARAPARQRGHGVAGRRLPAGTGARLVARPGAVWRRHRPARRALHVGRGRSAALARGKPLGACRRPVRRRRRRRGRPGGRRPDAAPARGPDVRLRLLGHRPHGIAGALSQRQDRQHATGLAARTAQRLRAHAARPSWRHCAVARRGRRRRRPHRCRARPL
jgi:hypothetical protein